MCVCPFFNVTVFRFRIRHSSPSIRGLLAFLPHSSFHPAFLSSCTFLVTCSLTPVSAICWLPFFGDVCTVSIILFLYHPRRKFVNRFLRYLHDFEFSLPTAGRSTAQCVSATLAPRNPPPPSELSHALWSIRICTNWNICRRYNFFRHVYIPVWK
jgi:hypothetical protein